MSVRRGVCGRRVVAKTAISSSIQIGSAASSHALGELRVVRSMSREVARSVPGDKESVNGQAMRTDETRAVL